MGADILFNNGHFGQLIERQLRRLVPGTVSRRRKRAKTNAIRQAFQLVAMVISIALTPMVASKIGHMDGCDLWRIGAYSHTVHGFGRKKCLWKK